jgi:hypothetical protein
LLTASDIIKKNSDGWKPEIIALGNAGNVHDFFLKKAFGGMKKPPTG